MVFRTTIKRVTPNNFASIFNIQLSIRKPVCTDSLGTNNTIKSQLRMLKLLTNILPNHA